MWEVNNMDEQVRFVMLVGLAGSGKSTFARELMEGRDDIVYLSSDLLRLELYGDENNQENNGELFNEMAIRTRKYLNEGKHVIYDATNINRKKRRGLLQQLPRDVQKVAVYIATDYKLTIEQNAKRERVVPQYAIERMYKNMQIPIYNEGWDKIVLAYDYITESNDLPKQFTDMVNLGVELGREGYDIMRFLSAYFDEFSAIFELAQDSKYHSFSVSRHTYYVYKYVLDHYEGEDKLLMLWTALLHDIGKWTCKSFLNRKGEETRYANFIGHEHVGSQLAVNILHRMGFDDEFVHKVATLIQFHMYLLDENANREKLLNYVGQDIFDKLEFLRDADTKAH